MFDDHDAPEIHDSTTKGPGIKDPGLVDRNDGNFTPFVVVYTIFAVLGLALYLFLIIFCRFFKYKEYWRDSDTGNRWIVPIWTPSMKTPPKQMPLDCTELENCSTIPTDINPRPTSPTTT